MMAASLDRGGGSNEAWPGLSVVIPVYNRADDLVLAVESVLAQTLPPDEIVIVDDASSDGSYERALDLSQRHPQIEVVRHQSNMGGSAARNTGWRRASGELIAFLDSDDKWYPDKLERQVAAIRQDPSVCMVFCGYAAVAGPSRRTVYTRRAPSTVPWERFRVELACGNAVGTASVAVVRRSVLEKVGGFDPAFPSCQDWELWYRLARVCRFANIAEPLVEYVQSSQGRISESRERVVTGFEMMLKLIRQDYGGEIPRAIAARHLLIAGDLRLRFNMPAAAAAAYFKSMLTLPTLLASRKLLRASIHPLLGARA